MWLTYITMFNYTFIKQAKIIRLTSFANKCLRIFQNFMAVVSYLIALHRQLF